ncbi:hypothetical protein SAMN05421690_1003122 [Nitrosomonas sp. Nm51]|uniref:hypothetical protein n=1 Tax=Nitrosomonas sp. Nm51 TaxID=133720 RepID=UPI0008CD4661|nr:hypothetical protein [Nitrosomonas sp. Nm51]SEQ91551.1 hypothetical protein SAMN05421690_1003122 [Nitrosomonas sp. Nm51]
MVSLSTSLPLSGRLQFMIASVLVVLMVTTRDYHFSSVYSLPGASWAIFFLAGVYLRTTWPLLGFLALSWWVDFAAYAWGGASGYCLTPAYGFLLPAYASLWLAGRWYAGQYRFTWQTLIPLTSCAIVGLTLCELFSSGGFYFFSGRFDDTAWVEFIARSFTYFPMYIQSFAIYAGIAMTLHIIFVLISRRFNTEKHAAGQI